MGVYINPGNSAFAEINDEDYIDKTMLIDNINQTIGKTRKLTCISRPRRFGKSYAAKMLTAYYDCSCDSSELFEDKRIASTKDYKNLQFEELPAGDGYADVVYIPLPDSDWPALLTIRTRGSESGSTAAK